MSNYRNHKARKRALAEPDVTRVTMTTWSEAV